MDGVVVAVLEYVKMGELGFVVVVEMVIDGFKQNTSNQKCTCIGMYLYCRPRSH